MGSPGGLTVRALTGDMKAWIWGKDKYDTKAAITEGSHQTG